MSFIVTVWNAGNEFALRGTVWTSRDRATVHATRESAMAALLKAKKFMHPRIFRTATVIETHFESSPSSAYVASAYSFDRD